MRFRLLCTLLLFISLKAHAAETMIRISRMVPLSDSQSATLSAKPNAAALRKQIAIQALSDYLKEFILEQSLADDSKALQDWITSTVNAKFSTYIPSWHLEPKDPKNAQVTLRFSTLTFMKDFEKSNLNKKVQKQEIEARQIIGSRGTALLINDSNGEIHIWPPICPENRTKSILNCKSAVAFPGIVNSEQLNLNDIPPANRLGMMVSQLQTFLPEVKWNPESAQRTLDFLQSAYSQKQQAPLSWPPTIPLTLSALANDSAFLAVFVVRNGTKSSTLEKIDLTLLGTNEPVRVFWSREINDPSFLDTTAKAIEKTANNFSKYLTTNSVQYQANFLRIFTDKKVTEKQVFEVESVLRRHSANKDLVLVPYDVSRNDVRYFTSIDKKLSEQIVTELKKDFPNISCRILPGDIGAIQIMSLKTNRFPN